MGTAGGARSGKSTLCVQVLREAYGEKWAASVKREDLFRAEGSDIAVTPGIWVWSHPLRCSDGDGVVLLMDTEGFGRPGDGESLKMILIAALVSARLAFNVKQQISDDILVALGSVAAGLIFVQKLFSATLPSPDTGAERENSGGIQLSLQELVVCSQMMDSEWMRNESVRHGGDFSKLWRSLLTLQQAPNVGINDSRSAISECWTDDEMSYFPISTAKTDELDLLDQDDAHPVSSLLLDARGNPATQFAQETQALVKHLLKPCKLFLPSIQVFAQQLRSAMQGVGCDTTRQALTGGGPWLVAWRAEKATAALMEVDKDIEMMLNESAESIRDSAFKNYQGSGEPIAFSMDLVFPLHFPVSAKVLGEARSFLLEDLYQSLKRRCSESFTSKVCQCRAKLSEEAGQIAERGRQESARRKQERIREALLIQEENQMEAEGFPWSANSYFLHVKSFSGASLDVAWNSTAINEDVMHFHVHHGGGNQQFKLVSAKRPGCIGFPVVLSTVHTTSYVCTDGRTLSSPQMNDCTMWAIKYVQTFEGRAYFRLSPANNPLKALTHHAAGAWNGQRCDVSDLIGDGTSPNQLIAFQLCTRYPGGERVCGR